MTIDEAILGVIPGPVFTNHCTHDGYVASFECEGEPHDLYVFDSGGGGQSTCIRWGNEGDEYYSPGGVENLITFCNMKPYVVAINILKHKGEIVWQPKVLPQKEL
jgi:hypothetical protein